MKVEDESPLDEALFEEIRSELARALRQRGGPALASRAEDLAHDVLLRVIEQRRKGEGREVRHASYWRRAAHHALIDEIRRRRRRREEPLDPVHASESPSASPQGDPARRAQGREIGAAIEACLFALTPTRRAPVFLHLQGYSVPESSGLLGWALKRTESALLRGMRDLRACLERKGYGP